MNEWCVWHAGAVEYWYSMGFISQATYEGLKEHCDFDSVGTLLDRAMICCRGLQHAC